jgi:DNA polymerase-1
VGLAIPPSISQASFCVPTHPERLLFLDIETFYPWSNNYPQPVIKPSGTSLLKLQSMGKAHPWAKDPRRCALRFPTVHDTEGTFGDYPLTIDLHAHPDLPENVLEAFSNCTLVAHNADFDLSVLRRYGIPVSSAVIDTIIASRLLGLGKEKLKVPLEGYCDLDPEELEQLGEVDFNPIDHSLAAAVKRYLGVKMDKTQTKLGESDWSRRDLSSDHFTYMVEDVGHLPALWKALETELRGASLEEPFRERMKFFPHLNEIKMTGNPVDVSQLEIDCKRVTAEKDGIREELREIFKDYRHPAPASRPKTIRIAENGKFKRIPTPSDEEFSPSNRHHWIPALALHGIHVENTQKATLEKIDACECRLLLKYSATKSRLNAIDGIARSTFPDGRVRASGWNQLAACTGRIISTEPNLQQVPRDWRTGFRVDPPKLWLKADLSQIEVLILAVVTQDQALIDLIRRGLDVYVVVAARIFDLEPRRGEQEGLVTDLLRDVAKPIVLGTSYGLTIYGFVRQMRNELGREFSLEEAQSFFDTFFEMFPGIAAYHAKAAENALVFDSVRTAGGTRRFLAPLLDDQSDSYWPSFEVRKKVLINTPIQGGQADLQIRAVNKFMLALPSGVKVVNLVHDEVDLIIPTRQALLPTAKVIQAAFREAFTELYGGVVSPNIHFSCGPSWGETEEIKSLD